MCGITTFFNSISFAGEELGLRNEKAGAELVEAIHAYRRFALTDQRIHCRFEVTREQVLPDILRFVDTSVCDLVSYMDHSPGQGQFQNEAAYRQYVSARYGYDENTIDALLDRKSRERADIQADLEEIASHAASANIPLAGHDADSLEHIEAMTCLGASISEFPMNRVAARAGATAGLHQTVGSTNIIRGGSQRTGMAAMELVGEGLANGLCSDYVPSTLLPALFKISRELDLPLHQAIKLATTNPAGAAKLADRGQISEGKRADLIAVRQIANQPLVQCTWCGGEPVFTSRDASQLQD
jgi:alpha-D-ribose 1-methylphosphonate 5-triphosphate diphosphatase